MNWLRKKLAAAGIEWHWLMIRRLRRKAKQTGSARRRQQMERAIALRRYRAGQLENFYEVLAGIRDTSNRFITHEISM